MSKTKHNPPGKPEPSFIKFSQVQRGFLNEIRRRQLKELNEAIEEVYRERAILEKIEQAPPGKYKLRSDLSGLDILPIKQPAKEKDPPAGLSPEILSEEKGEKDN